MINQKRLYLLNKCAADYFHYLLYQDVGKDALCYLREKRKLSDGILRKFGIGFAPNDWDRLLRYLRKKGYSDEEIYASDLSSKSKNGKYYSRFRNRIMFPIVDEYGNIIAFGGRIMEGDEAKYINSSDTPVFKKCEHLFALNQVNQSAMQSLILCEGYMDVIALHEAGFSNAIATLGTALTEEQVLLLSGYTNKVILSYDADEAGQNATDRAIPMLKEAGLFVKILQIPNAKDPDEYIKKYGRTAFQVLVDHAIDEFDYRMKRVQIKNDLTSQDGLLAALTASIEMICEKI